MAYNLNPYDRVMLFGNGLDGNATISTSTNLTRDTYYNNLTITGSGRLNTSGYRVFVRGTLDISAATGIAIASSGANGNNATTATGGTGGGGIAARILASLFGGITFSGGNGTTTNGNAGTAVGTYFLFGGYCSGGATSGKGGNSGANTGGNGSTVPTQNQLVCGSIWLNPYVPSSTSGYVPAGGLSAAGGGGAGDGTNAGGGGGGGASTGGIVFIHANRIVRSSSNITGAIQANGANGGNGAPGQGGNAGGGGGGAGSGGGLVYIVYNSLGGSAATNLVSVDGGTGGNGGNGLGTGNGGFGGSGGGAGQYFILNLYTGSVLQSGIGTVGVAGNANTGATGGTGSAGTLLRVSL